LTITKHDPNPTKYEGAVRRRTNQCMWMRWVSLVWRQILHACRERGVFGVGGAWCVEVRKGGGGRGENGRSVIDVKLELINGGREKRGKKRN
jgi:hypothetical protein